VGRIEGDNGFRRLYPLVLECVVSNEISLCAIFRTYDEDGFTPQETAARTGLNKTTASNTIAQLVENGVVERADDVYYIDPRRVDELTNRLRSLDSAVKLFKVTPDDDSYAEENWEQEVPSINPDEQTETSVERDSKAVKARAEALIEEAENSDPE